MCSVYGIILRCSIDIPTSISRTRPLDNRNSNPSSIHEALYVREKSPLPQSGNPPVSGP